MSNTNTSSSGGYLEPAPQAALPGGLTFKQFLQTVFVGISGLDGFLVRPRWQPNPPKQPDIFTNWMAIGLVRGKADANAYVGLNAAQINTTQRHEDLEIQCAFYGPESYDIAGVVRDGFQIQQNLEALRSVNMGFVSADEAIHMPDLVNERWVDKYEMSVFLRREILRTYSIQTLVSANGTIKSFLGNEPYLLDWNSNPEQS